MRQSLGSSPVNGTGRGQARPEPSGDDERWVGGRREVIGGYGGVRSGYERGCGAGRMMVVMRTRASAMSMVMVVVRQGSGDQT